jgi:hypothetical protein
MEVLAESKSNNFGLATINTTNDWFNNTSSDKFNDNAFIKYYNKVTIVSLYASMISCYALNIISVMSIICAKAFTPINILILNLAVSDVLYASCIPFFINQFTGATVIQTEFGCRISFFLDVTCMIVNVFSVAALTLERYLCLKEKQISDTSKKCKRRAFMFYIVLLWICAISFALSKTLYVHQVFHSESNVYTCGSSLSDPAERAYTIIKWILAFLLPYSIIIIFSVLLLKFLKEWSSKAKLLRQPNLSHHAQEKSELLSPAKNVNDAHAAASSIQLSLIVKQSVSRNSDIPLTELTSLTSSSRNSTEQTKICFCCCLKPSTVIKSDSIIIKPPSTKNSVSVGSNNNNIAYARLNMIKRRSTRFVLAVAVSFLCTWSPLWISQIILMFTEYQSLALIVIHNLTLVITYLECLLDPLLFILLTQNFREFINKRKLVICKKIFK